MPIRSIGAVGEPSLAEQSRSAAGCELLRAAVEAGATVAAVLQLGRDRAEIFWVWNQTNESRRDQLYSTADVEFLRAARLSKNVVPADDLDAKKFSRVLSPHLKSFLVVRSSATGAPTVILGFTAPVPPNGPISQTTIERINAASLAVWAAHEITRLRSELKSVANRLASRKVVERAKGVLQADHGFSEETAYEHLRKLSRQRRTPLAEIAREIVNESSQPDQLDESEDDQLTGKELNKRTVGVTEPEARSVTPQPGPTDPTTGAKQPSAAVITARPNSGIKSSSIERKQL